MSGNLGIDWLNSGGISVADLGESKEGVMGGMAEGSESKTLEENSGAKVGVGDGARVLEESKVLDGASVDAGRKGFETGGIEIINLEDGDEKKVAEGKPQDDEWPTWGVMKMVGRLLDGTFCMDDKGEDVNISKSGPQVNWGSNMDAWQGTVGKPTYENGNNIKGTGIDRDSDKLNWDYQGEGEGLNGNQDSVSNEMVPHGRMETEEVDGFKAYVLMPKERGKCTTEKEGKYYVSDLVWGKVRSHPWWPGQIFDPSAASNKAKYHCKKNSYLIAFFGDQTFAWNEASRIKPFQSLPLSQMDKHNNVDGFFYAVEGALDEVARRVEFGLSCPCLPQEVQDKVKVQEVVNTGIREQSRMRVGGEHLSDAASFQPGELIQFVGLLAQSQGCKTDRLQLTMAKAQLLAFNRWKGFYCLPIYEECPRFLEDPSQSAMNVEVNESVQGPGLGSKRKRKLKCITATGGSSQKRKHLSGGDKIPKIGSSRKWKRKGLSGDGESPKTKEKHLSGLMSSSSPRIDKKAAKLQITPSELPPPCVILSELCSLAKNPMQGDEARISMLSLVHELQDSIHPEKSSPGCIAVILSELCSLAKNPMQWDEARISMLSLVREFRDSIHPEKSNPGCTAQDTGKHTEEGQCNLETADMLGCDGTKDSYWSDRVIQTDSQDQAFSTPDNKGKRPSEVQTNTGAALNLDDRKEKEIVFVDLDAEESLPVNEASGEHFPTALILNFNRLESIPSITDLNQIFSRYGPLKESETEILTKSKRVKVIFKRREDAEIAFSSAGKYRIFGMALISYRLNYAPTPKKSPKTSRRSKRDASQQANA